MEETMKMEPNENDADTDLIFVGGGTALTRDSRVLKHVDKIENIISRMEARIDATVHSWQISRNIRRDFYLITSKMFLRFNSSDEAKRSDIRALIGDLMLESKVLKGEIQNLKGINRQMQLERHSFPLRLVSAEASFFYRAQVNADIEIALLNKAYREGKVSSDEFADLYRPYSLAYQAVKHYFLESINQSDETSVMLGIREGLM